MIAYRPNAVCPKCHRPPAVRYYRATIEWARTLEPEEPVENQACTKPGCNTIYVIAALCLQTAEIDTAPPKALHLAKQGRAA